MTMQNNETHSADIVFKRFVPGDTKNPNWDFLDTSDGGPPEPKQSQPPNFSDYFPASNYWPIKKMTNEVNEQIFDLQPPPSDEWTRADSESQEIDEEQCARELGDKALKRNQAVNRVV